MGIINSQISLISWDEDEQMQSPLKRSRILAIDPLTIKKNNDDANFLNLKPPKEIGKLAPGSGSNSKRKAKQHHKQKSSKA